MIYAFWALLGEDERGRLGNGWQSLMVFWRTKPGIRFICKLPVNDVVKACYHKEMPSIVGVQLVMKNFIKENFPNANPAI